MWCAENLAAGTVFPVPDIVIFWGSEESALHLDPQSDTTLIYIFYRDYDLNNSQASHYTQLVWRSSKRLGCHIAHYEGGGDQFYTVVRLSHCICSYFGAALMALFAALGIPRM